MIFADRPIQKILAIGAHADDIEIGSGGTILKLLESADTTPEVFWVVFSGSSSRQREARASAEMYLQNTTAHIRLFDFRDGFFPDQWSQIKTELHQIGREFEPDVILTHRLDDRHQDHRTLAELSWNVFRNHLILEYEIPKYEGDLGNNNFYCSLSDAQVNSKIDWLERFYPSQSEKQWFDRELFNGLMRLRGSECPGTSKFAEAYYCRKFVF